MILHFNSALTIEELKKFDPVDLSEAMQHEHFSFFADNCPSCKKFVTTFEGHVFDNRLFCSASCARASLVGEVP